jgi:hypothetical protein
MTPAPRAGPWTAADTALLAALVRARLPFALIGRRLGRTPKACRERCRPAGIAIPPRPGDRRTGTRRP